MHESILLKFFSIVTITLDIRMSLCSLFISQKYGMAS